MAQALAWSDLTTLVTPAGTLTFNAISGDTYWVDPKRSSGLGMGEIRNPTDDKGQTDGSILHDFFERGAALLVAGDLRVRSSVTEAGYVAARDVLSGNMVTRLRSILRATGTLNFGSGAAFTVKCNIKADFPALEGVVKGFVFGLVSASPPPT